MKPQSTYTIAFSSNEKGVMPLSVAIYSLLSSAQESTIYNIIVCSEGISQASRRSIEQLVKRRSERHSVCFLDMENVLDAHPYLATICRYWPISIWSRIFLPELLPHLERILYLDIDMLVCDDCSSLFSVDMHGAAIGAVYESMADKDGNHNKKLGIPDLYQGYFNTGTLLINAPEFRRQCLTKKILRFAHEHAEELSYPDQDAMNAVLYDKVFRLHPRWNWNDIATRRVLGHGVHSAALIRGASLKEVVGASVFPGIIHYCGSGKPWKYNYHITRKRYEAVLQQSGVTGYNLREGMSFKIFRKRLTHTLLDKLVWLKVKHLAKAFGITEPPAPATWGVSRDFVQVKGA